MEQDLSRLVAAIAADGEASASAILPRAIAILRRARQRGEATAAARALCRAQPAMAPVWHAAGLAMAAGDAPGRLDDLEARVRRAPAAIGRFARELLLTARQPVGTLRVLTFSASGAVRATLESIARIASLRVACGEGQPRREGRALAAGLALAGVDVELFPDAAITAALDGADAVVVGADAVLPDHFINKAGTRGLAAAGAAAGVPVFVLAGREKFLPGELARHLLAPDGSSDEIWAAAPAGVHVRNPYFESIPLNLASGVVTDVGLLAGEAIAACCRAAGTCLDAETIAVLAGERPHPPATRQP